MISLDGFTSGASRSSEDNTCSWEVTFIFGDDLGLFEDARDTLLPPLDCDAMKCFSQRCIHTFTNNESRT